MDTNELWADFPKTQPEFERRFGDERACVEYLIKLRWSGHPQCGRCCSLRLYALRGGKRWECADCRFQTSITSGTVLHRTRKPLRLWFRAIWEMMSRKNGVSAKDVQRILGFGSYQTAWTWLHKLRKTLSAQGQEPLNGTVQVDESYIGGRDPGGAQPGRNSTMKSLMLVAAETGGRVRVAQAPRADAETLGSFLTQCVDRSATVHTDGWRGYTRDAVDGRTHQAHPQSGASAVPQATAALQQTHWTIALVKRWWLGTHHGAIRKHHVQPYLDEFTFRTNRRHTRGVGRLVARVLERVVSLAPTTGRQIIDHDRFAPWFPDLSG